MTKRKNRACLEDGAWDQGTGGTDREAGLASAAGWLLVAMLALVPVVPFPFLPNLTGSPAPTVDLFPPPQALTFQFLTAVVVGLLVVGWIRRPVGFSLKLPDLLALGLGALAIASSAWSTEPEATRTAMPEVLVLVGFYAAVRVLAGRVIGRADRAILFAVGVNVVFGLGQMLGPLPAARFASWPEPIAGLFEWIYQLTTAGPTGSSAVATEPGGLLGNRNHLAFFLAVTFPFLLAGLSRAQALPPRVGPGRAAPHGRRAKMTPGDISASVRVVGTWGLIGLAGVMLLGTRCRGGMLGALAGGVIFLTLERMAQRGRREGALAGGVAAGADGTTGATGARGTAGAAPGGAPASAPGTGAAGGAGAARPAGAPGGSGPARGRGVPRGAAILLGLCVMLAGVVFTAADPAKTGTSGSRLFEWQLAFGAAVQRPVLGHGLASYGNQALRLREQRFAGFLEKGHGLHPSASEEWRRARFFRQAHNEILQLFFELGSAGLLFFGAFLAWFGGGLVRELREQREPGELRGQRETTGRDAPENDACGSDVPRDESSTATLDIDRNGARAALVAGVVCGLTGFPFQIHPVVMILTWALALLASVPSRTKSYELVLDAPASGRAAAARAAVPLLLAGFLACSALVRWEAETWYARGVGAMKDPGRLPEAAGCFERALAADPRFDRAHNDLGRVLMSVKRHAEAREQFEASDRLFRSSSARVNIACALAEQGDLEGALREFTHAAERSPSNHENHYRIGYTLARLERPDEALEALRRAAMLNAHDPRVLWEVAEVQLARGERAAAFEQAGINILKLRRMLEGEDGAALLQAQSSIDYLVAYWLRNLELARRLAPELGPDATTQVDYWTYLVEAWRKSRSREGES